MANKTATTSIGLSCWLLFVGCLCLAPIATGVVGQQLFGTPGASSIGSGGLNDLLGVVPLGAPQATTGSRLDLQANDIEPGREGKDSGMTALEIIQTRGYIAEQYSHMSYDGRTPLTVYHVINPKGNLATTYKYPAVMFHGFMFDVSTMISASNKVEPRKPEIGKLEVLPTDESLPFALANNNYDVWLVEARGANLKSHDPADDLNPIRANRYWNYSLDEEALYDLPSHIDFVLNQTQAEKVMYIGYSESTFFLFALLSQRPEFGDKLASAVAMAPVAYVTYIKGLAVPLMTAYLALPDSVNGNYLPQPLLEGFGVGQRILCRTRLMSEAVCSRLSDSIGGRGNSLNTPDFFATLGKGSSIRTLKHFMQLHYTGRLGMYDFGPEVNMQRYGQARPPDYDLSRITFPHLILVRAEKDFLSSPEDQKTLLKKLGTPPYADIVIPEYGHFDFIIGQNVVQKVVSPILSNMFQILNQNSPTTGGDRETAMLRDSSKPIVRPMGGPTLVLHPSAILGPHAQPIGGPVHIVSNLVAAIEPEKNLPVIGQTLANPLLKGLTKSVDNVLDETINTLPNVLFPLESKV